MAANRNWMAQTSRQDRLRHRVSEHMASVTSYTVTYSPALRNSSAPPVVGAVRTGIGEILRRKTRERRARRRETRQRSPSDWSISRTPASAARTTSWDSGREEAVVLLALGRLSWSLIMSYNYYRIESSW